MEYNEQEMNIFQVMNRIGRAIAGFFRWLLSLVGSLVKLMYKYKWFLLVLVVLSIGTICYLRRDDDKIYRAQMHLKINDGELFVYKNLIKQLNEYALSSDVEGLADVMGTTVEVTSKICGFEVFHVIDINNDSIMDLVDYDFDVPMGDTTNVIVPDQMALRVKLKSLDLCEEIQKSLLNYFSNNDYLSSLNISRLASLEDREWMFHNALVNLDSLQKVDYFKNGGQILEFASKEQEDKPFVTTKRQMYYNDMEKLFEINEQIAVDLSTNLEVVTVVSNLQREEKLENATWGIVLFVSSIALLIFIIGSLVWENREKIDSYLKS
jgi:hypothetical protein